VVSCRCLFERLDGGIHRELTLASAPGGFGKTTLVSSWVQQSDTQTRAAWLSLDESDYESTSFLACLINPLHTLALPALSPVEGNRVEEAGIHIGRTASSTTRAPQPGRKKEDLP
jgi:ATP/maltotriose-dependent transcriptional regulator MalT